MPKGLVIVESVFNSDDQAKRPKPNIQIQQDHYEEVDFFKAKLFKLGKVCSNEEKSHFIQLCKRF